MHNLKAKGRTYIKASLYLSGLLFSSPLLVKSSVVVLTIEKEFHGLITLVKVICHPSDQVTFSFIDYLMEKLAFKTISKALYCPVVLLCS